MYSKDLGVKSEELPVRDFAQQTNDEALQFDLRCLVELAIREDLARSFDITTVSIVPEDSSSTAAVVARSDGYAAGLDLVQVILDAIGCHLKVDQVASDRTPFSAGDELLIFHGPSRDILTCERTVLNFLGRLCGIATKTAEYVARLDGLPTRVYDTRKTTPGWRRLEKYAVGCGGGRNHRNGLHDAILIKDNHLACRAQLTGEELDLASAVELARSFLKSQPDADEDALVEIEVDTLEQFVAVLPAKPDIVLLDNMTLDQLCHAVAKRNEEAPSVQLEASGGVTLATLRDIAETGVDRISVGALTHSAINLDLGLDWK